VHWEKVFESIKNIVFKCAWVLPECISRCC